MQAASGVAGLLGLLVCAGAIAGDGGELFAQNCALCHQIGATGLAGQFPRLAGRIAIISRHAEGRAYLADVLTYGLSGTVKIDGEQIVGVMPPFAVLSDQVVADILSYLQTLGNPPKSGGVRPFTEQEISVLRARPAKALEDVQAERRTLQQSKVID